MSVNAAGPVAIILLAAGTSRRFGALKQLQELDGETLLRRAARTALSTGCEVTLVTGAEHDRISDAVQDLRLRRLHNPQWQRGMGHSLALAVHALMGGIVEPSALLVLLADQPLLSSQDLQSVLDAHRAEPDRIIAADYGERLGPPCLFPSRYFGELAALDGDRGARGLIEQHRDQLRTVPLPHAALDVDTPEDLARAAHALRDGLPR